MEKRPAQNSNKGNDRQKLPNNFQKWLIYEAK